jgi:ATP-dependent RNA helicase DDX51/DBP6
MGSLLLRGCRLFLLLSKVPHLQRRVEQYSSTLTAPQRSAVLDRVKQGKTSVMVVSDAMARGMDVDSVHAVVNYDAPVYPKSYIHRAGRTARAGREGTVYSLVRPEEMRHFRGLLHKLGVAGKSGVVEVKLGQEELKPLRPVVKEALKEVQALLQADKEQH